MVDKLTVGSEFWKEREKRHDAFCRGLKALAERRLVLARDYELILERKRIAKGNLLDAIEEAGTLMSKIKEASDTLNFIKKKWLTSGGTEDNFYLNLTASKITKDIGALLEIKEKIVVTIPNELASIVLKLNLEFTEVKLSIKENKLVFKDIQVKIDSNSKEEVVISYQDDVPHYCDATASTVQFQLQIRKQTYKKINELSYTKIKGKWFLINKNLEEKEIDEKNRVNLERIINKFIK